MTRRRLLSKLPPLMEQMQRVHSKRIYQYYLDKYTKVCEELATLNKRNNENVDIEFNP